MMLLLLLFCGGSAATSEAAASLAAAEHDNFICSRNYGPGSYPLPCKPARDHWQSPFRNKFVITAWGGPEMQYFANGTMKADRITQYAEAHFNLVMGSCIIGCEGPGPNPSGPPGSPEAALDCVSRAARDLDALGLKLALHPTDINGIQNDRGVDYPPYDKWPQFPNGSYSKYVLGGVEGMGGVTDSGPGSWSLTTPEVTWVVRELELRNLSHVIAQIFFHDDEIGDSAATANSVRWLRENAPWITPQVNTFSDAAPESLYKDGQFLFAPEQYAVEGGAIWQPLWDNLTRSKADAHAMFTQELIMFANNQVLAERYRLDYWPLFALGDGGDIFDIISDSLIRIQAYSAVAYGARGLYYYCYGGAIWNESTPVTHSSLPPSVNYLPLANYQTVQGTNADLMKWGTLLLPARFVGAVRRPADSRNDHSVPPGPRQPAVAMDDELLVGVFSDGLNNESGWMLVVNLQAAMAPGTVAPRNVSLWLHPACAAETVTGGEGGWFDRHHHPRNATTASLQRITVELDAGAGALLRVTPSSGSGSTAGAGCGARLRAVRTWWYDPRTINLRHSYPETSLKSATYGGSEWMPQGLENLGYNKGMSHDSTGQGYGRGWCNGRPCLPGRFRFFHQPGGLAGDTSSFIIGGSMKPWRTDAEAKAWANAAFLVGTVPVGASTEEEGDNDALALALTHGTAHGMFVMAAPAVGTTVTKPATLLRVADATSCHTNFAGFVLATNYSAAAASTKHAAIDSADAMRSVQYWALSLILGVANVTEATTLGAHGVPFPAMVLPPVDAAGQPPHAWAQAVVDLLAPIGGAAANHSVKMTLAVQLEACLESDSLLRFSTFGAVLFGAQALWWDNLATCAPLGSAAFELVAGINRRVAQFAEPLFLRKEYFLESTFQFQGNPADPPPHAAHDDVQRRSKPPPSYSVPPFGPTEYVITDAWSTSSSLVLPPLNGASGSRVHFAKPGATPSALVQAMDAELLVVHFRNVTADGLNDTGFCKSSATCQAQDCLTFDNVLFVMSTALSHARGGAPVRQLNITLRGDIWTTHPIEPNAYQGFTTDCNLGWLGPFIPLRLPGGAAQVVSYSLGPGPVAATDVRSDATRRRVGRSKPAPWRPPLRRPGVPDQ